MCELNVFDADETSGFMGRRKRRRLVRVGTQLGLMGFVTAQAEWLLFGTWGLAGLGAFITQLLNKPVAIS